MLVYQRVNPWRGVESPKSNIFGIFGAIRTSQSWWPVHLKGDLDLLSYVFLLGEVTGGLEFQDYPLVNKQLDPENHQFLMETSLPTPTTARVYVNLPEGTIYGKSHGMIYG